MALIHPYFLCFLEMPLWLMACIPNIQLWPSVKWMELENIIPSEVTQTQKDMHGMYYAWYMFTNKWILAKKKSTEYPRYTSQNSKRSTSWITQVRTPQSHLGERRKQSQVGMEGGICEGKLTSVVVEERQWDRRTWSGIGWGKRTEALRDRRKNGNRQPQEIGGWEGPLQSAPEPWEVRDSQD